MTTITTVKSTSIEDGVRIVKVLRYGKDDVQEAEQVAPFGIDSNPIKNMSAIYADTAVKGEPVLIGYINEKQLAKVGETRLFSTDEKGNLKTYLWLKNDGTIEIGGNSDNMVRYSKMAEAFEQLRSDFNAFVNLFNSHIHTGGTISGSTGTTATPGSGSTADITESKIDEIKTL